jgi:hypothetical protein
LEPTDPSSDTACNEEPRDQQELDGLRIRQVSQARRAAMRMRSYSLITAAACAVGSVDLAWRAARRYWIDGIGARLILYLLAAGGLAWLGWKMFSKAQAWGREARQSSLPEPASPPDFSTLSDGSHIVKNLEDMQ